MQLTFLFAFWILNTCSLTKTSSLMNLLSNFREPLDLFTAFHVPYVPLFFFYCIHFTLCLFFRALFGRCISCISCTVYPFPFFYWHFLLRHSLSLSKPIGLYFTARNNYHVVSNYLEITISPVVFSSIQSVRIQRFNLYSYRKCIGRYSFSLHFIQY